MARPNDPASAANLERLELCRQILNLRGQSWTYRQIATKLAMSLSRTWELAQEALRADKAILAERAADVRCVESSKLDAWESSLADRLKSGDETAIAVALRIAERRAKLLGLDAPQRTENREVEEFESRETVYARLQAKLEALVAKQQKAQPQAPPLALPAPEQPPAGPREGVASLAAAPAGASTAAVDHLFGVLDAVSAGHIEPPIQPAPEPFVDHDDARIIDAEIVGRPSYAGVPLTRAQDSMRTPSAIPPHRSFFHGFNR